MNPSVIECFQYFESLAITDKFEVLVKAMRAQAAPDSTAQSCTLQFLGGFTHSNWFQNASGLSSGV